MTFKWILVVSLAYISNAQTHNEDLKAALWMAHCARDATVGGVPAAGIPPHEPVVNMTKLNYSKDVLGTKVKIQNSTWAGIPEVTINGTQLTSDSAEVAIFQYDLYWPKFLIHGDYAIENILFKYQGSWTIEMDHVHWAGSMNINKTAPYIKEFVLRWIVKDVKVNITNAGIQGDLAAKTIENTLKVSFDTHIPNEPSSKFLQQRLNSFWLANATRVGALLDWCKHNRTQQDLTMSDFIYSLV